MAIARARLVQARTRPFSPSLCPPFSLRSLHSARRVKSVAAHDLVSHMDSPPPASGPVPVYTSTSKNATPAPGSASASALSILPFSNVLRTYIISTVTSSRLLLPVCMSLLRVIVNSSSPALDVDRNVLLRWAVRHTFYPQFCAGQSVPEVRDSIARVRRMGYDGVILESTLEIVGSQSRSAGSNLEDDDESLRMVETWHRTMVESVSMTGPGDFLGIKWSGLGPKAFQRLRKGLPPTPAMLAAMTDICDRAEARGVRLLPSAEEDETNVGIDAWSLSLQRVYNAPERLAKSAHLRPDQALIFNTYQLYLKSGPAKVARHMAEARKDGFVLGVKLVRGAYLATERRDKIWATEEETHRCYDGVVEALLRRQWNGVLKPVEGEGEGMEGVDGLDVQFPKINLFIASHNRASIRKAQEIRNEQAREAVPAGTVLPDLYYGQLYGMADEISCELAQSARAIRAQMAEAGAETGVKVTGSGETKAKEVVGDIPRTVKCIAWGSPGECLQYLFRRAAENKEAATRTADTRDAMRAELWRRVRAAVGWS